MALDYIIPEFDVVRNDARCTRCRICETQCANGVHTYNADGKVMVSDESKCVNCQRCVSFCPTHALKIVKNENCLRENANWSCATVKEIYKQASTGGVLLSSMGNPQPLPVYWDRLLINASQVTNPPIDPLREPMETRVFLGKKPSTVRRNADGTLCTDLPPQLELSVPILFSAMSYGSISYNAHACLAQAAQELRVQLSVSCPRRVELTVSAGELQVLSGESPVYRGNAYSGSGRALSVLWVIAGAQPDAVYRMTVNEKVLALSCDEQGTWTIRQQ